MLIPRNIVDFTDLICECLTYGWEFTQGPPTEAELQRWAALGRAEGLFVKPQHPLEPVNKRLHLIRCKEEASVMAGHHRWKCIGLWTAWLDESYPSPTVPQCGFDQV